MRPLKRIALKFACALATRNPVPDRYVLGDESNDFTFLTFNEKDDSNTRFTVLHQPLNQGLHGRIYDAHEKNSYDACINFNRISDPIFYIHRVYRSVSLQHSNLFSFIFLEIFKAHVILYWRRKLSILWYKKTFRFSAERMAVLAKIVDWRRSLLTTQPDQEIERQAFSHIDLYTYLYGWNAWYLGSYSNYLSQTRFIMMSFVDSGELRHENGNFFLNAKALASLSDFEQQSQRHKDSVKQNNRIFWLTIVIAATALGQLIWSIYSNSINTN